MEYGLSDSYYSQPTTEGSTSSLESSGIAELTVTQTFYALDNSQENFVESNFSDIIFKDGITYWLSSRDVNCDEDVANFDIRVIYNNQLYGRFMLNSTDVVYGASYYYRPVVTLNNNTVFYDGNGNADNPYKIKISN